MVANITLSPRFACRCAAVARESAIAKSCYRDPNPAASINSRGRVCIAHCSPCCAGSELKMPSAPARLNVASDTSSSVESCATLAPDSAPDPKSPAENFHRAKTNRLLLRLRSLFRSAPKEDCVKGDCPATEDRTNRVHRSARENTDRDMLLAKAHGSAVRCPRSDVE